MNFKFWSKMSYVKNQSKSEILTLRDQMSMNQKKNFNHQNVNNFALASYQIYTLENKKEEQMFKRLCLRVTMQQKLDKCCPNC